MTEKTLRDEFAMAAMQGDWAAQSDSFGIFTEKADLMVAARQYYCMADAMMKVREEQTP